MALTGFLYFAIAYWLICALLLCICKKILP